MVDVTYVVAREVVHGSLCKHAVVLELTLSQWWCVASDDDELGLARSQALEGGLVAECDLARLQRKEMLADGLLSSVVACRRITYLDCQGQFGVDAVGGLGSLLWCHLDFDGSSGLVDVLMDMWWCASREVLRILTNRECVRERILCTDHSTLSGS